MLTKEQFVNAMVFFDKYDEIRESAVAAIDKFFEGNGLIFTGCDALYNKYLRLLQIAMDLDPDDEFDPICYYLYDSSPNIYSEPDENGICKKIGEADYKFCKIRVGEKEFSQGTSLGPDGRNALRKSGEKAGRSGGADVPAARRTLLFPPVPPSGHFRGGQACGIRRTPRFHPFGRGIDFLAGRHAQGRHGIERGGCRLRPARLRRGRRRWGGWRRRGRNRSR